MENQIHVTSEPIDAAADMTVSTREDFAERMLDTLNGMTFRLSGGYKRKAPDMEIDSNFTVTTQLQFEKDKLVELGERLGLPARQSEPKRQHIDVDDSLETLANAAIASGPISTDAELFKWMYKRWIQPCEKFGNYQMTVYESIDKLGTQLTVTSAEGQVKICRMCQTRQTCHRSIFIDATVKPICGPCGDKVAAMLKWFKTEDALVGKKVERAVLLGKCQAAINEFQRVAKKRVRFEATSPEVEATPAQLSIEIVQLIEPEVRTFEPKTIDNYNKLMKEPLLRKIHRLWIEPCELLGEPRNSAFQKHLEGQLVLTQRASIPTNTQCGGCLRQHACYRSAYLAIGIKPICEKCERRVQAVIDFADYLKYSRSGDLLEGCVRHCMNMKAALE